MSLINRCSFAWLHSIVGNKSIGDRFRFVNFYVTQRTIRPFLPSLCAKVSTLLPDIFLSQGSIRKSSSSDHCKLFTSITDSYWTVANTSFGILPNREEWYNNKTGEYILVVFYVVFTYRNKMKAGGERASERIYIIASLQSVVNRIALSFIHVLTKHHFKKVQRYDTVSASFLYPIAFLYLVPLIEQHQCRYWPRPHSYCIIRYGSTKGLSVHFSM